MPACSTPVSRQHWTDCLPVPSWARWRTRWLNSLKGQPGVDMPRRTAVPMRIGPRDGRPSPSARFLRAEGPGPGLRRKGAAASRGRFATGSSPCGPGGTGPGQQPVEDNPKAVQVGPLAGLVGFSRGLLGRHEGRGADQTILRGQVFGVVFQPGQAEIREDGLTVLVDQHIRGLEVAMHQAMRVNCLQRLGQLPDQPRPRPGRRIGAVLRGTGAGKAPQCRP